MMKRVMILIFSLAVLIGMGLATSAAIAGGEGPFGEIRWRWEGFKNYDHDGDIDDNYGVNFLRSRLGYRTGIGERGWFKMVVENNRVLGKQMEMEEDEFMSGKAVDSMPFMSMYDNDDIFIDTAYLGISDFLFEDFHAFAGRFGLGYGRERIIGREDWNATMNFRYDGFKGHYKMEYGWLDLLCLKLDETFSERYTPGEMDGDMVTDTPGDTDLRGVFFHYEATDEFWFEPYILYATTDRWEYSYDDDGDGGKQEDPTPDKILDVDADTYWTFGALFDYMTDTGLHLYAEGVLQSGTWHSIVLDEEDEEGKQGEGPWTQAEMDMSAKAFYAGLFYEIDNPNDPFLGIEFNFASGTKASDDEWKTFDSHFGSFSEYMGRMNIVGWSNTSSFRLAGGISPTDGLDLQADVWFFKLATDEQTAFGPTGGWFNDMMPLSGFNLGTSDAPLYDTNVGTEIDFFVDYEVDDGVDVEAGVGIFSYGDYWKDPDLDDKEQPFDSTWFAWIGTSVYFK